MLVFCLRRAASAVPTLFIVVTLAFFMIRLAPGGPFDLERPLEPAIMARLNQIYQLDQPLWTQYTSYLAALLRGDFGPSFVLKDFTVNELIAQGLPVSMALGSAALVLALSIGISLGTLAALKQNRAADLGVMTVATIGVTVPNFVIGPLLQIVFGLWLAWLPVAGFGDGQLKYFVLPVVVLAIPQIAVIARLTRAAMIEALGAHHVRTLQAQGLGTGTVVSHALRAALLPVVAYLGPAAAAILTGSVVVEKIFGLPGIGRYFVDGALNRDYTLVMGTVVLVAVFVLAFNLIVDVVTALLDPRIRLES